MVEHQQHKRVGADLSGARVSKQRALIWLERKNTRKSGENAAGTNEPPACSV